MSKKNCHNCKHHDYYHARFDEYASSGHYCNKRDYRSETEEGKHLYQMSSKKYREHPKKCCELKQNAKS